MCVRTLCRAAVLSLCLASSVAHAQESGAASTAPPAATSDQQTVPLPPLQVESTAKPKPAKKKSAKKSTSTQTAATPQPQSNAQTSSSSSSEQSGLKSPPGSFVAKVSGAATKTGTPIVEAPQSISVVTREQLDKRDVKTIVEALQYVPGIYTDPGGKDPRFDIYTIRGFNGQGNSAYRDGLREIGNGDFFTHFRTETYGVERIDVIRGPSAVLYGQIAPGGLVDVITKRPTRETIRKVQGKIGTNDLFEGAFDLSGAVDPTGEFMFRLTGVARDADSQVAHFSDFVPDDRLFIAPSFTWRPDDNTTLTVLTDFQHDKSGNAFTVPVANVGPGGLADIRNVYPLPLWTGDPTFNKFDQEQFRLGYQFEHRFNDTFTVRQNLRYGEIDLEYRYLTPTGGIPIVEGAVTLPILHRSSRALDENAKSFTVDNQLQAKTRTGAIRHTILAGLDYQRYQLDSTTLAGTASDLNPLNPVYWQAIPTPATPFSATNQDAQQTGIYAQDQAKLDNWILTIGGRYDWAELDTHSFSHNLTTQVDTITDTTAKDEAFTGRAGLTYLFDFGLAPYVSYSESFLPTTGTDKNGNPFDPTTGQQYEVGIKYEPLGTRSRLTLAAFDLTQQNVKTQDPTDPNFSIQTGEVRSRGFEAEASANIGEGLELIATYTALDVEVTKSNQGNVGKDPILTPEQLASVFADYTFHSGPLSGFGFGGGVRYVGETYMDLQNKLKNDAYIVVDATLHYDYDKNTSWQLNVNNLLNNEEATCTTTGGCQYISPQIVTSTMKYRW